jgi:hypothetical protein
MIIRIQSKASTCILIVPPDPVLSPFILNMASPVLNMGIDKLRHVKIVVMGLVNRIPGRRCSQIANITRFAVEPKFPARAAGMVHINP